MDFLNLDFSDPTTIIVLSVIGVLIVGIIVAAIILIKVLNKKKDNAVPAPDYIPSPAGQEPQGKKRSKFKSQHTVMPGGAPQYAPQEYAPQGRGDYGAPEPVGYQNYEPDDYRSQEFIQQRGDAPGDFRSQEFIQQRSDAPGDFRAPEPVNYRSYQPDDYRSQEFINRGNPAPPEYPAPAAFNAPEQAEYPMPGATRLYTPASAPKQEPEPADFFAPAPAAYNAPAPEPVDFVAPAPAPADFGAPAPADFGAPAPYNAPAPAPMPAQPYMDDGEGNTVLLGMNTNDFTMVRRNTSESFHINKPEFFIGKERAKVDFCVTNNNSVSRRHARMTIRDGKCYICDLGSTNCTYINGTKLSPNQEIALIPGDVVKLSNEEFDFIG